MWLCETHDCKKDITKWAQEHSSVHTDGHTETELRSFEKKGWERRKETEKVSMRGAGSLGRCKVLKRPQFALCPNAMSCRRAGQPLLQSSAVNGIIQQRRGVTLLTRRDGEHVRFHYHRGGNNPFVSLHQYRCEAISQEKALVAWM